MVLQALQGDLFEPLQSVDLSALSMKMALLTPLTSVKRVGDQPFLGIKLALEDVLWRSTEGSKPRVAHWIVDVILLPGSGFTVPLGSESSVH